MGNVIPFPGKYSGPEPEVKIEEIKQNVDMMKHFHIQETIQNLAPLIFNQLDIAGFSFADEEDTDIKDGAFIIESVRALLCKHYDIYHPFQAVAENIFYPDDEEPGVLRIVDELALNLKKDTTTT